MTGNTDLGIPHLTDAELIGSGGFSVVYAATHTLFDRRVAVKVLTNATSDSDRRKFEQECRAMGRLSGNPNVVTVFHADYTSKGEPYLIMELVEGGTLSDRLASAGALAWDDAVDIVIAVGTALAHAHREQILHRDIKPENILMDDGVPKLTDFGIARLRDSTGQTSTHISASWLHTAPETVENQRDERSDLYSLASTLYTLIAGHAPYRRDGERSVYQVMHRLLNDPVPELPAGSGPPQLSSFLVRALAKDPGDRPQTASELVSQLAGIRGVAAPAERATTLAPAFEPTAQVGGLLAGTAPPAPPVTDPGADGATTALSTAGSSQHPPSPPTGQPPLGPGGAGAGGAAPQSPPLVTSGSVSPPGNGAQILTSGGPPTGPGYWAPTSGGAGRRRQPAKRSRQALVAVLAVAVLVAGGTLIALMLADRGDETAGPGDETGGEIDAGAAVAVPRVVGRTEAEAVAELEALGIEVTVAARVASDVAGEGVVISQDPEPGTEASSVALTVSIGSEAVGDETDDTAADDTGDTEGTGDPAAGGDEAGDSTGPETGPVVPDVVGLSELQAVNRLDDDGISVTGVDRVPSETVDEGIVISQDPPPGAEVSSVRLTISTGPPEPDQPLVPDVTGMEESEAVNLLVGEGIGATVGERVASSTVAADHVIAQAPPAGTRADEVTLRISLGRAAARDCLAYDAEEVEAVDEGASGWLITDGSSRMLVVDDEADAEAALALVRRHTSHCFIGRGNQRSSRASYIVEYWTGSSGIATTIPDQDCITYDQDSLEIVDEGATGWLLTDGRSRMQVLDDREDAVAALVLARQHTRQCFIGRDNARTNRQSYIVEYWE